MGEFTHGNRCPVESVRINERLKNFETYSDIAQHKFWQLQGMRKGFMARRRTSPSHFYRRRVQCREVDRPINRQWQRVICPAFGNIVCRAARRMVLRRQPASGKTEPVTPECATTTSTHNGSEIIPNQAVTQEWNDFQQPASETPSEDCPQDGLKIACRALPK